MTKLDLVRVTADDSALAAARADLDVAIHAHDFPYDPPRSRRDVLAQPAYPFPGEDVEHLLGYADGELVGFLDYGLPTLDNLDNATVELGVRPDRRREGFGRQLAEYAIGETRRLGRKRIIAELCHDGPDLPVDARPGPAFGQAMGGRCALVDQRRRLDLTTIKRADVEQQLADAASTAYHLVEWINDIPEDILDEVATLEGRMVTDSPMGELDWEPEHHDAERWHGMKIALDGRGRRTYGCASVHVATGAVTGYTQVAMDEDVPQHAWQWSTIVLPAHRGHRLGLRLKAHTQLLLQDHEPLLQTIDTWNAEANGPMILVNEAMGYRFLDTWGEWQLDLS